MPDRTRSIRKEICLNEQELNLVQHKMHQLGTHNFGAHARKMLIDGYILNMETGAALIQYNTYQCRCVMCLLGYMLCTILIDISLNTLLCDRPSFQLG